MGLQLNMPASQVARQFSEDILRLGYGNLLYREVVFFLVLFGLGMAGYCFFINSSSGKNSSSNLMGMSPGTLHVFLSQLNLNSSWE